MTCGRSALLTNLLTYSPSLTQPNPTLDLRQDQLTLQILRTMERKWEQQGL